MGNQSIEPKWKINETIRAFPSKFWRNLKLLQLEIEFEAFQERTIYLQYSLRYHTKTIEFVFREHRYFHFFESTIFWDRTSITHQSIHYEIRIPKNYLKNNGHLEYGIRSPIGDYELKQEEKENFFVIIITNMNKKGYVEATFIHFGYQDTNTLSPEIGLIILILVFLVMFSLLVTSIIIFNRKVSKLSSKENLGTETT